MTRGPAAAIAVWRSRGSRHRGDRAYVVYLTLMVLLVAVFPLLRALWVALTSAEGIALLASAGAPHASGLFVVGLWVAALIAGRERGPALRPPVLTHAFTSSDLPYTAAFGAAALRAGSAVTALTVLVAALAGAALVHAGLAAPLGAFLFVACALGAGVVAAVAWLAGQAFPRASLLVALTLIGFALAGALLPSPAMFLPWNWVGAAYPGAFSAPAALAAAASISFAVGAVALAPSLLNRLDADRLLNQSMRWDAALSQASGMELAAAVSVYRTVPSRGRAATAVRLGSGRVSMFLRRDAIGAARTPGRLIAGLLAVAAAGAVLTLAAAPGSLSGAWGAVAGAVLFFGLGPLTDGVRHAADIAGDFPLYGLRDEHLVLLHALFPLAATIAVLVIAVLVTVLATGADLLTPLGGSLALALLTLATRVASALKGSLPPVLLAPIPTPMGDLGAAVRLVWAMDALLLAALSGIAAALVGAAPLAIVVAGAAISAVALHRWRHR